MRIKALKGFLFLTENDCDFGCHKMLGIPRASLWDYIKEIEEDTSLKLINRSRTKNTLTEEGLELIKYAKNIVDNYEKAVRKKNDPSSKDMVGQLILSTTTAIATTWLMPSLKDFHINHPKMAINIIANDSVDNKALVSSDILLRPINESEGFTREWYIKYQMGLFASREYLERCGVPQRPEDLLNHSVLSYGEQEFSFFEEVNWIIKGKYEGLPKLKPSITINSTTSLYYAALKGLGICPAAIEANSIYQGDLVRVLPHVSGPEIKTYLCTKSNVSDIRRNDMRIFSEYFEQYLKNYGITVYYD